MSDGKPKYCRDCKNLDHEAGANDQWFCKFWERWVTLLSSCRTGYDKRDQK